MLGIRFSRYYVKENLYFGFPTTIHTLGSLVIPFFSRYIITERLGIANTGIFMVAFQIAAILSITFLSINQAFSVFLFKHLAENNVDKKLLVNITLKIAALMVSIFIVFNLFSPLLFKLFINEKFYISKQYVFYLSLGFLLQGFYFLITNYIFFHKKTFYLSISSLFVALSNIGITLLLFNNNFQLFAVVYAFPITFFIYFIITFYFSNKVYPLPWLYMLKRG